MAASPTMEPDNHDDYDYATFSSAIVRGDSELVRQLIVHCGVGVDQRLHDARLTPLMLACEHGHASITQLLLEHGATVELTAQRGVLSCSTALDFACNREHQHVECVRLLLQHGHPPTARALRYACERDALAVAQLLCAHGARWEFCAALQRRAVALQGWGPQGPHTVAWVRDVAPLWTTRLHYVSVLTAAEATALLREGADLHAREPTAGPSAPTPLSLARAVLDADREQESGVRGVVSSEPCAVARLILEAQKPWSPHTHHLFGRAERARAVQLLLVCEQLLADARFAPKHAAGALRDLWLTHVLPQAVKRDDTSASTTP